MEQETKQLLNNHCNNILRKCETKMSFIRKLIENFIIDINGNIFYCIELFLGQVNKYALKAEIYDFLNHLGFIIDIDFANNNISNKKNVLGVVFVRLIVDDIIKLTEQIKLIHNTNSKLSVKNNKVQIDIGLKSMNSYNNFLKLKQYDILLNEKTKEKLYDTNLNKLVNDFVFYFDENPRYIVEIIIQNHAELENLETLGYIFNIKKDKNEFFVIMIVNDFYVFTQNIKTKKITKKSINAFNNYIKGLKKEQENNICYCQNCIETYYYNCNCNYCHYYFENY